MLLAFKNLQNGRPNQQLQSINRRYQMALTGVIKEVLASQNSLESYDLARFAVHEHNNKANAHLEFSKVVKVKEQVVSGTVYYITLEAIDGGQKKVYEAKIWVKHWENFKQLQGFEPVESSA